MADNGICMPDLTECIIVIEDLDTLLASCDALFANVLRW